MAAEKQVKTGIDRRRVMNKIKNDIQKNRLEKAKETRPGRAGGGPILKNPNKADLDKSGDLSSYEKTRAKAIEKSMGLKSGGLALKGYGKAYMKGGKVK